MNFFETTNPKPDPEMSNEIRRAVEASYGGIYSQLRRISDRLGDTARAERANVIVVQTMAKLGSGSVGAVAFVWDEAAWYFWNGSAWVPTLGGAGGGKAYRTRVVKAANSKASGSTDYTCDGTDDEEEILAALAASDGGGVILLDGTYVIGSPISLTQGASIVGLGASATILRSEASAVFIGERPWRVEVAGMLVATSAGRCADIDRCTRMTFRDVVFSNGTPDCVRIAHANGASFINCDFQSGANGLNLPISYGTTVIGCKFQDMSGTAIALGETTRSVISDSTFRYCANGIAVTVPAE